jgi:hypothetical protein
VEALKAVSLATRWRPLFRDPLLAFTSYRMQSRLPDTTNGSTHPSARRILHVSTRRSWATFVAGMSQLSKISILKLIASKLPVALEVPDSMIFVRSSQVPMSLADADSFCRPTPVTSRMRLVLQSFSPERKRTMSTDTSDENDRDTPHVNRQKEDKR